MLLWKATPFGKFTLPVHNNLLSKEDNSKYNSSSITSPSKPQSFLSTLKSIIQMLMKKETSVLIWLKPVLKNGHQLKEWPKSWKKLYPYWWPQIWTHQLITKQLKTLKTVLGLIKPNNLLNNMPNDV